MSITQLPGDVLTPKGQLAFGDFSAILGRQTQPAFVWTDFMAGSSPDYILHGTSLRLDKIANVAHAPEVFVPHHQTISGVTTVDGAVYTAARTDLPGVLWTYPELSTPSAWAAGTKYYTGDTVTNGGNTYTCTYSHTAGGSFATTAGSETLWVLNGGTSNFNFQAFPDKTLGFSWLSFALKTSVSASSTLPGMIAHFRASQWASGGAVNMDEQGFFVHFSRFTYGGSSVNNPAEVDVVWKIHAPGDAPDVGISCCVRLSQKANPRIYMQGQLVRQASQNASPSSNKGSSSLGGTDSSPFVKVSCVGGKMQIMALGMTEPVVIHLDRLMRSDIKQVISGNNYELSNFSRFPNSGKVWYWRGGGNPSGESGWVGGLTQTTVVHETNTSLETASSANLTNQTVAVLEPRIGQVDLLFRRITHASWAMHPLRFEPSWSYKSIQQQVAFTPDSSTPWYYTCYAGGDNRHKVGGTSWAHHLYPSSTITVSDGAGIAGTEIHQFQIVATMPTLGTYNGENFSRYTVGIERVDSSIAGLHEYNPPTTENTTLINLGADSAASRIIKSIKNIQSFDMASLQVSNRLEIVVDNWNGRFTDLIGKLGIAGIGNVGVMFRWGYQHQDTMGYAGTGWFSGTGPGFSRYVGFANEFSYSGREVTITCPDDFDRIRNHTLTVPPMLDGWNHYRAIYTLLQMAGVPDSRIGFMAKVPSTPSSISTSDPDYSTGGYFLPVGVGSNTWTPQLGDIKVGQLLAMIQQLVGYVMYVDAYGKVQYEPFLRSTPSGSPKRVFRTHDVIDSNGAPVQFYNDRVVFSNANTRNIVALVGIDAYGPGALDPIAVKLQDNASISSAVGSQPINYLGYRNPFVMIDPRFYSRPFASASAQRLYSFMRQPQIMGTFTCTGGQSDLYVMDWIVMEHWRSGLTGFPTNASGLPLFVTDVVSEFSFDRQHGSMAHTQVSALYIDPTLATDTSGSLS